MPKRRISRSDDKIISLMVYGILFIFIFSLFLIYWIFKFLIELIISFSKNNKSNLKTNNEDNDIIIEYELKEVKVPRDVVKTPYDELFKNIIIQRGIQYYKNNNITNYRFKNNSCSANIVGTNVYNTNITFDKSGKIKNAKCNCPYFLKDENYCKHIYSLLLKYCKEEKIDGFIDEKTHDIKYEKMPKYTYVPKKNMNNKIQKDNKNNLVSLGLLSLISMQKNKKVSKENEKEKIKKDWGLLDWEADFVQKGTYKPWQFSEPGEGDELDEDDYYYDE